MELLQIALIILILLLGIFLSITGIQVFLILRDLRKSLDKISLQPREIKEVVKMTHRQPAVHQTTTPSRRLFKKIR